MRKEFVIGATLFVMGFVACTQPSQPTSGANPSVEIGHALQPTASQPTVDDYVPDIETSSKDENLDQETEKKLKTKLKKIQHTFSNGQFLRYRILESGDVVIGDQGDGMAISVQDHVAKFIKDKQKEIKGGLKPKAIVGSINRWNGSIPYIISNNFTVGQRNEIEKAINWWNKLSGIGIQFVPHGGQWDVVKFEFNTSGDCSSFVGKSPFNTYLVPQTINLGISSSGSCLTIGTILHEMAHAAGVHHEHVRCDRDNYVDVTWDWWNIAAGFSYGKNCSDIQLGMYDYSSRMHYNYGTNFGGTVAQKIPTDRFYVGDPAYPRRAIPNSSIRNTLSRNDILAINSMYGFSPDSNITTLPYFTSWFVKNNFWHIIGRADGDGWSATVGLDTPNQYMVYGPYQFVDNIASGWIGRITCCSAWFEMLLDNTTANNDPVAVIDVNYVYPDNSQLLLTSRVIRRKDFSTPFQYQTFELDFERESLVTTFEAQPLTYIGRLEYRVRWLGTSYVRVRRTLLKM